MDSVNQDHDSSILDMKNRIETAHRSETTSRGLRSRSCSGAGGFALFGDNVGKIQSPRFDKNIYGKKKYFFHLRFNTGLTHNGSYLQMALTLGVINRVPSAHLG